MKSASYLIVFSSLMMTAWGCSLDDAIKTNDNAGGGKGGHALSLTDDSETQPTGDISAVYQCRAQEKRDEMLTALQNRDYTAWKTLMAENGKSPRVLDYVNESNFGRFAEAHALKLEGKIDEANAIRAEIGLKPISETGAGEKDCNAVNGMGKGKRLGKGNGQGRNR